MCENRESHVTTNYNLCIINIIIGLSVCISSPEDISDNSLGSISKKKNCEISDIRQIIGR